MSSSSPKNVDAPSELPTAPPHDKISSQDVQVAKAREMLKSIFRSADALIPLGKFDPASATSEIRFGKYKLMLEDNGRHYANQFQDKRFLLLSLEDLLRTPLQCGRDSHFDLELPRLGEMRLGNAITFIQRSGGVTKVVMLVALVDAVDDKYHLVVRGYNILVIEECGLGLQDGSPFVAHQMLNKVYADLAVSPRLRKRFPPVGSGIVRKCMFYFAMFVATHAVCAVASYGNDWVSLANRNASSASSAAVGRDAFAEVGATPCTLFVNSMDNLVKHANAQTSLEGLQSTIASVAMTAYVTICSDKGALNREPTIFGPSDVRGWMKWLYSFRKATCKTNNSSCAADCSAVCAHCSIGCFDAFIIFAQASSDVKESKKLGDAQTAIFAWEKRAMAVCGVVCGQSKTKESQPGNSPNDAVRQGSQKRP